MLRHIFIFLAFLPNVVAQKPYFQQEVNTKIQVSLDDQAHRLRGDIEIEYINKSPDTLHTIWLHCWANAHKLRTSAMGKQFLRLGSGRFYFAPDTKRGGYSELDFTVDGQRVAWRFDLENIDIVQLTLPKPLLPGEKIVLATPFNLKIPDSFSRLGHVGQTYQMTQWFPKPAVYDNRGWHAMPYLNMGEFYSEFGTYDVRITLPANYVVGATGSLVSPEEIEFLKKKVRDTKPFLQNLNLDKQPDVPSDKALKTIRFRAENVHDFAWFADKRFLVTLDSAHLASGKVVACWAMFPPEGVPIWNRSADYVRRAVEFYSHRIGEYPWPHATAVMSALSAGGGMEYPMITVINNEDTEMALDNIITHEVGHNWFYGVLASNERDHAWMDEGFNSFYELAYMLKPYGRDAIDDMVPTWLYNKKKYGSLIEVGNVFLARNRLDIPTDSHSDKFDFARYGLQAYKKTELALIWLEASVGQEKFDAAMQDYFRRWKFKHPYPADFEQVMRDNGLDIAWFMEQMQTTRHCDYALKKAVKLADGSYQLNIQNRDEAKAPFVVAALKNGKKVAEQWFPAHSDAAKIQFPKVEADAFVIDHDRVMLQVSRKNDYRKVGKGLFRGRPLQLKMFAPFEDPRKLTIGAMPWLGWNNYDKTQLGVLLYNPPAPGQQLQYYVAPGYGTGSNNLTGLADFRWRLYGEGAVSRLTIGLSGKMFSLDFGETPDDLARYYRLEPSLRFDFADRSTSFKNAIVLRQLILGQGGTFSREGGRVFDGFNYKSKIYELKYQALQAKLPRPFQVELATEFQRFENAQSGREAYLRQTVAWKQQFYYKNNRAVVARLFAGFFLHNSNRFASHVGFGKPGSDTRGSLPLASNGPTDYRFDDVFFGRNARNGLFSQQISETGGGFKIPFCDCSNGSNAYLFALNLKADLPWKVPYLGHALKPWLDLGLMQTPRFDNAHGYLSGGLSLEFLAGRFAVYFPLVHSANLKNEYDKAFRGNYARWITWRLNLNELEPMTMVDRFVR